MAVLAGLAFASGLVVLVTLTAPAPPSIGPLPAAPVTSPAGSGASSVFGGGFDASHTSADASDGQGRGDGGLTPVILPVGTGPEIAGMDSEAAVETLLAQEEEIDACLREVTSSIGNRLRLQLTVNANGSVTKVAVLEDDLHKASATKCVDGVVRGMKFKKVERSGGSITLGWSVWTMEGL